MPRIPDDLLERLKHEIPLERLAESKGVALKQHGADLLGLCPFHDDHEPSLVITPTKNLWHCLGACQAGGTVIDWVMKAEGVSFRHAVEILRAEFFPLDARPAASLVKRSTVPALPAPVELDAGDEEIKRQVVLYYHETLKQSPEALAYLERRGLVSADVVDRFKLGYSNRTLGLRLPLMNRKTGFEIRTRLQKLGLFRESGHEHFSGSLVIPVFDEAGSVTEIYGRKIRDDLRPGTPLHLYLPGAHRGVFNVEALSASKEIILCEALIDALTFWCAGFRNVTSSYGVEGFTPDHLAAFKRYGTEHVLVAYDRDDAGNRAAEALSKKLIAEGIACSRVLFPKGMDANEYARKVQPASTSLGVLIRSAEWIGGIGGTFHSAAVQAPARPLPLAASPPAPTTTKAANEESETAAKEENHSAPAAAPAVVLTTDDEAVFRFEDRRYRIRGLKRNMSFGVLKLNVLATREGDFFDSSSSISGTFLDTFDLASARSRSLFEKQTAHELGVKPETIKWDLGQIVRALEELQQKAIEEALKPKVTVPAMSDEERAEALEMLSAEDLVERILSDFTECGVVGEETNKLLGYVAAVSRKLTRPLAVIVRSSSAAGKTALMEAVLSFIPKEDREKYSALSEHSLFYFEGKDFKHKVLAIVEEEGAQRATYALKLLQSEGEITIASTGKDPGTGRLVTKEYRVEGPVMIFLVSTAVEIDEELLNRALVLTVDEGRDQTRAIHRLQRESQTLEGLWASEDREEIYRRHHNAQRLLRPLHVVNPFVRELTFLDDRTRTRRDHTKYLTLIEAIALLHQYQRPVKTDTRHGKTKKYIEASLADVALANRLASEVLGRSLDELPPQTRRLLLLLDEMVKKETERLKIERCDVRFSRRDVRRFTGWTDFQARVHLDRLVSLEYALVHRGGRGQSFVYELLYDGQGKEGELFVIGLADVSALSGASKDAGTTSTSRGEEGHFEGPSSPQRAPIKPLSSPWPTLTKPAPDAAFLPLAAESLEIAHQGAASKSYAQAGRSDGGADGNGRPSPRPLLMRRLTRGF
jgi:DNA primase catalytic core